MTDYILTLVDTVSIQRYIFGSNRLRENIGASELVKQATKSWIADALKQTTSRFYFPDNIYADDIGSQTIEAGQIEAEVVYVGGGNAMILFVDEAAAKQFTIVLSQQLLREAPGMEIVVAHTPFNWQHDALGGDKSGVVYQAQQQLEAHKAANPKHTPLLGLSVTAACQSTKQVATFEEGISGEPPRLFSSEIKAKLQMFNSDKVKKKTQYSDKVFDIPADFDHLGRTKGDSSYLAVVHIDGNGMGKKIRKIAQDYDQPNQNRQYIQQMRKFSSDIQQATQTAWEALENEVKKSFRWSDQKKWTVMERFDLYTEKKATYVPYRLLVLGGDDVTFVCDGRLGLSMSHYFLQAFEAQFRDNSALCPYLKDTYACAGIAFIKSHYPFARAYQLAENLCESAKTWVKESKKGDYSALDWQFAMSGVTGSLTQIREREYRLPKNNLNLTMRPIALLSENHNWRNWQTFVSVVNKFNNREEWPRNKVKKLRGALRAGKGGVKQFLAAYPEQKLPAVAPNDVTMQQDGWANENCGYFDPIEALEFYIPLHEADGDKANSEAVGGTEWK